MTECPSAATLDPHNPLYRTNKRRRWYCAACQVAEKEENNTTEHQQQPQEEQFRTCPKCQIFCYCSEACQQKNKPRHYRDCDLMSRFQARNLRVKVSSLILQQSLRLYPRHYDHPNEEETRTQSDNDQVNIISTRNSMVPWSTRVAHLYERVVDEYVTCYEEIKAMGMSSEVGIQAHNDYYLVKPRIPLLLAALGHDDEAITELALAVDSSGRVERQPRLRTDDLLEDLWRERDFRPASWTSCLLLPLLLVKQRLVSDYRKTYYGWELLERLTTETFLFPEDVQRTLRSYLSVPTKQELRNQEGQLQVVLTLLEQEGVASALLRGDEVIKEFLEDDGQYNEDGLFVFVQNAFATLHEFESMMPPPPTTEEQETLT